MTHQRIVHSLREMANGYMPSYDISDLLYKKECYYLLYHMPNNPYLSSLGRKRIINIIAVNKRYQQVQPFFENNNIPYAVIKGAVLSQRAYKDPFVRLSKDIDILIDRSNEDEVKELLASLGFIQGRLTPDGIVPFSRKEIVFHITMSHQTAPFVKPTNNKFCPYINVDINTSIIWGESSFTIDSKQILEYVNTINICGVNLKVLSIEADFISLCMHHYKDMNSIYLLYKRGLQLSLFLDIYYYIKNNPMNYDLLLKLADQLQVGQYIFYCIYFTNLLFDSQELYDYLKLFDSKKSTDLLYSFGLSNNEKKLWRHDFFDRLFTHENIIEEYLTESDRKKIYNNELYM